MILTTKCIAELRLVHRPSQKNPDTTSKSSATESNSLRHYSPLILLSSEILLNGHLCMTSTHFFFSAFFTFIVRFHHILLNLDSQAITLNDHLLKNAKALNSISDSIGM